MVKSNRGWWKGVLVAGALMMALVGGNNAQDKKPLGKNDPAGLYNSLRDVINNGAKLFNDQGDHAGCYRLYQGSLLSVRPLLAPGLQKRIDEGVKKAEGMASFSDRAFELRRVLDEVRTQVKPKDEKKVEEKKKVDETKKETKKTEEKKKEKKADDKKPAATDKDKGQVSGKITLQGKALAGGYFVTLVSKDGKKFSSTVQKDGTFQLKTPIATGEYRVAVEPIPGETKTAPNVPAQYRSETTSGLMVRITAGRQTVDLKLLK